MEVIYLSEPNSKDVKAMCSGVQEQLSVPHGCQTLILQNLYHLFNITWAVQSWSM